MDEEERLGADVSFFSFPTPIVFSIPANRRWEEWDAPECVMVVFRESLVLELRKGWNLCALPFVPDGRSVERLMAIGDCWGWSAGRTRRLENIRPGQGFWLYSDKNQTLEVSGENAAESDDGDDENDWRRRGDSVSPTAVVLKTGWNLVGKGLAGDLANASTVYAVKDGIMVSVERTEDGGYDLKPGIGYWIFIP